jgi:predicted unusual protein kinase regulating ubiquinone biosynthesis (AarF/ABC1/UbiB family)
MTVPGQALALRADLLKSPDYVKELEKLQDAVGTFPDAVAKSIIRDELGLQSPEEIFDFVQDEPIASASIGQVTRKHISLFD